MKKLNLSVTVVLSYSVFVCALSACQSNWRIPPAGSADVLIDGKSRTAKEVPCHRDITCHEGRLNFTVIVPNRNAIPDEIYFQNVSLPTGDYRVHKYNSATFCKDTLVYSSYATFRQKGVPMNSFSPAGTDNTIQITSVNGKTGEIKGSFKVNYSIVSRTDSRDPDTIRVVASQFQVWLPKG